MMESSPDGPAVTKQPQLAGLRHWMEVDPPAGGLSAVLPPHNLLGVFPRNGAVQALSGHTRQLLAELRGTP